MEQTMLSSSKMAVKYDGSIRIATGKSRKETNWKNREMAWSDLVNKLSSTMRTHETYAEYKKLSKAERDVIKDVGGFVGGSLKGGRRKADAVANRTLITLDLDYPNGDVWSSVEVFCNYACLMYSTHSHEPKNPRLRIVVPVSRPVFTDEYQYIARTIASDLGIDFFDDTTYQAHRLMYWPSTASDGEYIFKLQDEPWLNPEDMFNRYPDWTDISYWPESSRSKAKLDSQIKKQEDPLEKKGVIGAFCRTYSISEVIDKYLSDVYSQGLDETRYSYLEGSTSGGVVVYEDKFSYSHHGTDPASGILCNAFDLVRIHKFVHLDENVRIDTKPENLPSFKAITQLAINDEKVKMQLGIDRLESAKEDFKEVDTDWMKDLAYYPDGSIKSTIDNVKIILENDQRLKGKFAKNEFDLRNTIKGSVPWNKDKKIRFIEDNDESGLRHYLEKVYGITRATQNIKDATSLVFTENKFHPIRDYLNSLVWDGKRRVETVLIDYFGVEDNVYTRAAARIFICGAVARVFQPGCQLDYVTTIAGKQGIRKGTFFRIMAKNDEWYTELATIKYKEAIEETTGKWIVEMAEMAPTKKSEIEEMKAFITNKSKTIRMAYAHNSIDVPRQYVLVASTNELDFLKDPTGDRRYLPVDANMEKARKKIAKDLGGEVDQIYAEAVKIYKEIGHKALMLSQEEGELAKIEQDNHRVVDEEEGTIIEFLDTPLPKDWYDLDLNQRQDYFHGFTGTKVTKDKGIIRDRICIKEIMNELYCKGGKIDLKDSNRIKKIMQGLKNWEKQKSPIKIKGYGSQRVYYRIKI